MRFWQATRTKRRRLRGWSTRFRSGVEAPAPPANGKADTSPDLIQLGIALLVVVDGRQSQVRWCWREGCLNVTPPGHDPLSDLLRWERFLTGQAEEQALVDKPRALIDVRVRRDGAGRHCTNALRVHGLGEAQLDRPRLQLREPRKEVLRSGVEGEDLRLLSTDLGVGLEDIDSEPDYGVVSGRHPLDTPTPIAFLSTVVEIHSTSTGERVVLQRKPVDYPACVAMGDGYGVFMQRSDVLGGEPQERISGRYPCGSENLARWFPRPERRNSGSSDLRPGTAWVPINGPIPSTTQHHDRLVAWASRAEAVIPSLRCR